MIKVSFRVPNSYGQFPIIELSSWLWRTQYLLISLESRLYILGFGLTVLLGIKRKGVKNAGNI